MSGEVEVRVKGVIRVLKVEASVEPVRLHCFSANGNPNAFRSTLLRRHPILQTNRFPNILRRESDQDRGNHIRDLRHSCISVRILHAHDRVE